MNAKNTTILVVDDEDKQQRLVEGLLAPTGYRVISAGNGLEAVDMANQERPDVVLLDVMMPELNGYEVCEILKRNAATATVPVLMITSLKERDSRLKGIRAGANDFITKPIDKEELIFRIKNALYTKGLFDVARAKFEKLKKTQDNTHDKSSVVAGLFHEVEKHIGTLKYMLQFDLDSRQEESFDTIFKNLHLIQNELQLPKVEILD